LRILRRYRRSDGERQRSQCQRSHWKSVIHSN
jgi:hypothetical protein